MPQTNKVNVPGLEFSTIHGRTTYLQPSALVPERCTPASHRKPINDFGFKASRNIPLLVQVEQHLGERIDGTVGQTNQVEQMMEKLTDFDSQVQKEGSLRDSQ